MFQHGLINITVDHFIAMKLAFYCLRLTHLQALIKDILNMKISPKALGFADVISSSLVLPVRTKIYSKV